jgi:tetratricopeptide (TPR) repeat protein
VCQQLFDPNDPDKLTILGMVYGQHGHYQEALRPLQEAARLDPDSSEIQHDLGLTLFRLSRFREARGPLQKAVALRPDFLGSNALLGATLYMVSEDEPAFRALYHAHQLNPPDESVRSLLFKVAVILGDRSLSRKDYDRSIEYFNLAATLRPDEPVVKRRLQDVKRIAGRNAGAKPE